MTDLENLHEVECLVDGNLVYVPVPKNASTMYLRAFFEAGWQPGKLEDLYRTHTLFGHIQDPHVRHAKGVVEFLKVNNMLDIDLDDISLLLACGMFDPHSYPISHLLNRYHDRINWIPLDHPKFNGNQLTNMFLKRNGSNLRIPTGATLHESPSEARTLFEKIMDFKLRHNRQYGSVINWNLLTDMALHTKSLQIEDWNKT